MLSIPIINRKSTAETRPVYLSELRRAGADRVFLFVDNPFGDEPALEAGLSNLKATFPTMKKRVSKPLSGSVVSVTAVLWRTAHSLSPAIMPESSVFQTAVLRMTPSALRIPLTLPCTAILSAALPLPARK